MTVPGRFKALKFPCECVSGGPTGYSDPWADIARHKLLTNGTKEEILNLVAREPKTISQLAQSLNLSAPSVHTHINDMLKSELLREAVDSQKKYPAERYYEPNFPVIKRGECESFDSLCGDLARQMAELFAKQLVQMESAFAKTKLAAQGWEFSEISQCLFANVQRSARALLEQRGILAAKTKHGNGAEWVFWAEEPTSEGEE